MPKHKRAPLETWVGGPWRKPGAQSADPVLPKSCISGSIINYRAPCTSGEGRLCEIFGDLPLWNEYFGMVDLELRELSAGELSLVETRSPRMLSGLRAHVVAPEPRHAAATLLHQLLTQHRCLVSVELNEHTLNDCFELTSLIRDALRKSTSLRKLELCLPIRRPSVSLGFGGHEWPRHFRTHYEDPYVHLDHSIFRGLADFLVITRSLTTLDISQLPIEGQSAEDIVCALKWNATITALSVSTLIVSPRVSRNEVVFADYMRKNRTLQSLSMKAHAMHDLTGLVIEALFASNTLSELNMIQFWLNAKTNQLICSHLEKNQTLRSFNLVRCNLRLPWYPSDTGLHQMENFGDVSVTIRPWLVVLTENKTLIELTLNF
ncbi:hypothetical protein MTO96_002130 [Rhipicephalus appendiculatus]